ncbi:MAG: hypothetical protein ACX98W_21780, partial [bacterium]
MRSELPLLFRRRRNRRRRRRGAQSIRRGRLALAALSAFGAAVLVGALIGRAGWPGWARGASTGGLPEVSAPPPPIDPARLRLEDPPRSRDRFEGARLRAGAVDPAAAARLVEFFDPVAPDRPLPEGPVRIEYSLDETLTERVFEILRRGRVARGHAIVSDPRSGRLLAWASTDPEAFPPERAYPAA